MMTTSDVSAHDHEAGTHAPASKAPSPLGVWRLARRLSSTVRRKFLFRYKGRHDLGTNHATVEQDRMVHLRQRSEQLSSELLAERDPNYPPNENAIAQLEQAFSEHHRRRTGAS